MEVPQGACATQINFLVDISRLLEKNMTRVASSMKESMSSISDLLETLLVFMGADSRDASAEGSMESILLQLLDSIKHIQDSLKLFSSQSCRLKDNLNSGADVEIDITKHFAGRLNAIAPNFKKYVSVQHAFFQSVDYELNEVYQELSDRSSPNGTSSGKKRPPVPAPRPRTAQPRGQKAEITGKGGVCFETDYPLAPRTKRSGSVDGPNSSPSRNSPPPVPRRGAARSHDDLSRPFVELSLEDHQRGKTVGGSSSIPVPSVPRPQGEAPPPSRPSSTQVDFVPAQNLSATQTLLATVSVLGATGNAPVLVNHYHSKPAPTQLTPPASTAVPTTSVSIHTSSPIPTRKPSPAPPVSPSGGRGTGGLTVRPTHNRSASSDDSGILGGSGQINTQKNVNNPNNRATYSPRRVVPPIFEGDSGEWVTQKRQAKGTTGVDPALVQGRREYWKGNQDKVVSSLQPSYQL